MTWEGFYSYEDVANILEKENALVNSGRGVGAIRSYIQYIRMGMYSKARVLLCTEWDKIRVYPPLVEIFRKSGYVWSRARDRH